MKYLPPWTVLHGRQGNSRDSALANGNCLWSQCASMLVPVSRWNYAPLNARVRLKQKACRDVEPHFVRVTRETNANVLKGSARVFLC